METVIAKIKLRRGTEEGRKTTIFDEGEPAYAIDSKRLTIGDGITVGGNPINTHTYTDSLSSILNPVENDLAFYKNNLWWYYKGTWLNTSIQVLPNGGLNINENGYINIKTTSPLYTNNSGLNLNYNSNLFKLNDNNQLDIILDGIAGNPLSVSDNTGLFINYDTNLFNIDGITGQFALKYTSPIVPEYYHYTDELSTVGTNGTTTYYVITSGDIENAEKPNGITVGHMSPLSVVNTYTTRLSTISVDSLLSIPESVIPYNVKNTIQNSGYQYCAYSYIEDQPTRKLSLNYNDTLKIDENDKLGINPSSPNLIKSVAPLSNVGNKLSLNYESPLFVNNGKLSVDINATVSAIEPLSTNNNNLILNIDNDMLDINNEGNLTIINNYIPPISSILTYDVYGIHDQNYILLSAYTVSGTNDTAENVCFNIPRTGLYGIYIKNTETISRQIYYNMYFGGVTNLSSNDGSDMFAPDIKGYLSFNSGVLYNDNLANSASYICLFKEQTNILIKLRPSTEDNKKSKFANISVYRIDSL